MTSPRVLASRAWSACVAVSWKAPSFRVPGARFGIRGRAPRLSRQMLLWLPCRARGVVLSGVSAGRRRRGRTLPDRMGSKLTPRDVRTRISALRSGAAGQHGEGPSVRLRRAIAPPPVPAASVIAVGASRLACAHAGSAPMGKCVAFAGLSPDAPPEPITIRNWRPGLGIG